MQCVSDAQLLYKLILFGVVSCAVTSSLAGIYPYRISHLYWFIMRWITLMVAPSLCYLSRKRRVLYVWRHRNGTNTAQAGRNRSDGSGHHITSPD